MKLAEESVESGNIHAKQPANRSWIGLLLGGGVALAINLQPHWRDWLAGHAFAGFALVAGCVMLFWLLRSSLSGLGSAWALTGAGILGAMALGVSTAEHGAHDHEHQHSSPPTVDQSATKSAGQARIEGAAAPISPLRPTPGPADQKVSADTVFDVVLIFDQNESVEKIEAFRESVIKRVYGEGCVRQLPCIARMLRLFEIGPERAQIIAFDFMQPTPELERAALFAAIESSELNLKVMKNTSPNQAVDSDG